MEEIYLSPLEVSELLKVKKNTVYEMIKRGDLPAAKMGKQFRIAQADVYAYMGQQNVKKTVGNIVICGQDILLDVLCSMYNELHTGTQAYRSPLGSYNGLYEMYHHENYVATCHMWDGKTDTYNTLFVERMLPGEQVRIFHLLSRWQGLYVQKGNPKNICGLDDFLREDVRIVNREKGSGIRVYLDEMMKAKKISSHRLNGYDTVAPSHLSAATMVQRGQADAAIGNEKTSRQVEGIEFIPLKKEQYDIVFRKEDLEKEEFRKLLEIIRSEEFKREAQSIEGYDVALMGQEVQI